jgi:hypothetical protein
VQEEEFANMQKSDPVGTLRLLLSRKQTQATTSSEHTTSDFVPSTAEISSMVRQDSLLLKLTTDFTQRDVLKQLEENPACAYNHLAFLKKLCNPLTNEVTLGKVIQLGSIVISMPKLSNEGLTMVSGYPLSSKLMPCSMRRPKRHKLRQISCPPKQSKGIQGSKTVTRTLLSTSSKLDSWKTKLKGIGARSLKKKPRKLESKKK